MKKMISLLLGVMIIWTTMTACTAPKLDNVAYVKAYDQIMYKLEGKLDTYVYQNLIGYFAMDGFNNLYGHQDQVTYMGNLIDELDNVLYELDEIGHKTDDPIIQKHQSKVEYALKEMRSHVANFLKVEVVQSIMPNKNTLYRDVYRFMVNMNKAMLQYVENEMALTRYLDDFRVDKQLSQDLQLLKDKNRLRYLYVFMMTSTYIAPMEDYTGLHVFPDRPWELRYIDLHHVYELSFAILIDFREFYLSYMDLLAEISADNRSEDMAYFFEEIEEIVNAYERYYNIRNHYPEDFYKSNEFMAYQGSMGNRIIGRFQDFTEDYPDLIESGEAYMIIREMLFDERLQQMMYE